MNALFEGNGEMAPLVDRLVCGELDEPARGRLLAWLEEDARRWRLCGLAFLEAQAWSKTLGEWPAGEGAIVSPPPASAPATTGRAARSRRAVVRRTLVAAGILAAFALGLAIGRLPESGRHDSERSVAGTPVTGGQEQPIDPDK